MIFDIIVVAGLGLIGVGLWLLFQEQRYGINSGNEPLEAEIFGVRIKAARLSPLFIGIGAVLAVVGITYRPAPRQTTLGNAAGEMRSVTPLAPPRADRSAWYLALYDCGVEGEDRDQMLGSIADMGFTRVRRRSYAAPTSGFPEKSTIVFYPAKDGSGANGGPAAAWLAKEFADRSTRTFLIDEGAGNGRYRLPTPEKTLIIFLIGKKCPRTQ